MPETNRPKNHCSKNLCTCPFSCTARMQSHAMYIKKNTVTCIFRKHICHLTDDLCFDNLHTSDSFYL